MKMKRMLCGLLALMMAATVWTGAMAADGTLRYNDRGAAVTQLQSMLTKLGYTTAVDGVFGPGTEAAVKKFQADKGLKVDGVAGTATLALLRSLTGSGSASGSPKGLFGGNYTKMIRGETSSRVRTLQKALNDLGYSVGKVDGVYGSGTEAAVRWFQQVQGLDVDGKAGEKTLRRMESFFNENGTVRSDYTPPTATSAPSAPSTTAAPSTGSGIPARTLRPGDSGEDVRSVQSRLKALGYYTGTIDGKYGSGTTLAVTQFQIRNNLSVDGKAGTVTNAILFSQNAIAASAPGASATNPPSSAATGLFGGVYTKMIRGETSSRVRILQKALSDLGYSVGAVDGVYGTGTEAAVRLFQQRQALAVDGKAGENTLRRIESFFNADGTVKSDYVPAPTSAPTAAPALTAPTRTLRPGDEGSDVRNVQARLQQLGYYLGSIDGKYGSGTMMAVLQFQLKNNLDADGKAGPSTNARLFSDSAIAANAATAAPEVTATPAPTETMTAAPTNTPAPTGTPGPQYAIPTRTLRSGDSGTDVVSVQSRLKELGYYTGALDGVYGSGTVAAVKAFQQANNLNVDGVAGTVTYTILFGDKAIAAGSGSTATDAPTTAAPTATPATNITLTKGSTGEAVTQLQKALLNLGYTVNTNGSYTNETVTAVKQFQTCNGLNVDGVAGPKTLTKLYSGTASGPNAALDGPGATTNGVLSNPPSNSEVRLLHWYNDIKPNLSGQPTVQIYDPASGLSWNIKIFSKGQHADGEPPTLQDTQIMYKAFGNQFTWNEKPVFVKLPSGVWCIASMHDRPHESDMINPSINGFEIPGVSGGHLCIHFPRDMAETQKNAPSNGVRHQNDIRKKWKEMTGEDIPW